MNLTEEQSNLPEEVKQDYERLFNFGESEPKNNGESQLINNKDNENEKKDKNINNSEKKYINDTEEEIIINNENDKKVETSIIENNLSNSETKNYILVKYNNIENKLFIIQHNNESNSNAKNHSSLSKKRGRPKKSDDQREHTKFNNDNIEKKIDGIIINSTLSFINDNIDDQNEKLKTLSYEETANLKNNMNKKIKDILQNASTNNSKNHNKNLISKYESKLKEIFELPMYKIIHHISGKEIGILMGLEKKYLSLKTQKLKKENEDYKQRFKEHEAKYLKSIIAKYPIINEITNDNTLNSINNFDLNFIFNNNANMEEADQLSLEMIDSLKNNNINDSDLFTLIPCNSLNEEKDEILSFSEC
jgi:hypothetical protein